MTEEELKKVYYPIAKSWEMIRKMHNAKGTDEECEKLKEMADHIYKTSGQSKFAKEIIIATINEIDRIMKKNKGDE